jgi:DNA polymerase-3 subunit delta'
MSWNRVRGHANVRQSLQAAFQSTRLAHAYFLVGPDGVGKRLFAGELAKALLCEHPPAPLTACDKCPSCRQVEAGSNPDLLTLRTPEGKHELPIEEVREFCPQLAQAPAHGGRRVGIIEDADEFNEESANSFLKTLEEPPPNTVLLLIATSTTRQLPTILSRCQILRFNPLGDADLDEVLREHGVEDANRRGRLVRMAGGSVSRAMALNDDSVWTVREELIRGITDERPDFLKLSTTWSKFVEDAGKDTKRQRDRAAVVVGFLADSMRQALRLGLGARVSGLEPNDEQRLRSFAARVGQGRLLELTEKCLEADYRVERRIQLILMIESVLDQFVRVPRA